MLLLGLVRIVGLVILALYTLASLPALLRQVSSPIFVFALLNASIFLLSLARISPPPSDKPAAGRAPSSSAESVACVEFEIGTAVGADEMEEEKDIREIEEEDDAISIGSMETERCVEATEEEELSNAEFNRIIEAFLEKQKRFHYQENISILV